jgi:imidazole glycerol phosphate synthase glutamine amidotransferase subunit
MSVSLPTSLPRPVVGIINYSTGNIFSIKNALIRLGYRSIIVSTPSEANSCDAFILPGVGHFDTAVNSLCASGLDSFIVDLFGTTKPLLAICLGFQILTIASQEGKCNQGLSLFPTHTKRITTHNPALYKIPHIGWNTIQIPSSNRSPLFHGIRETPPKFYFSNKYAVTVSPDLHNYCTTTYSHDSVWIATISYLNFHGVQFHPEKSGHHGEALIHNFLSTIK